MSKKINIVVRLQHWMDSVPGQTFLNYAYSWGASIVILGALFKLTHLPGGNFMLFIGMGTEVVVFFLAAFDRPFDKDEVGKELPPDYETDEEIADRMGISDDDETNEPDSEGDTFRAEGQVAGGGVVIGGGTGGGTIIVAGGSGTGNAGTGSPAEATPQQPDIVQAAREAIALNTPQGDEPFENEAQRLAAIIRAANDELLRRAQAALSPEMEEATQTYIDKLRLLSETFAKVDEQSAKLTRDSEEMENLSRTLTGINKVYELHLKGISLQVGTIEQINEQTNRLAQQIEELNGVYGRMIEALTVNMRGAQAASNSANNN